VSEKSINIKSDFDPNLIGLNIDEYLIKSEQQFSDIRQGFSKKIIWANKKILKHQYQLFISMDLQLPQRRFVLYLT